MTNVIKLSDTRWQIKIGTQTIYVQCLKSPQDITPGEYVVDDGEEKAKIEAFDLEECVYKYKKGMTIQAQQSLYTTYSVQANLANTTGRTAAGSPPSKSSVPVTNKKNGPQSSNVPVYPVYAPGTPPPPTQGTYIPAFNPTVPSGSQQYTGDPDDPEDIVATNVVVTFDKSVTECRDPIISIDEQDHIVWK